MIIPVLCSVCRTHDALVIEAFKTYPAAVVAIRWTEPKSGVYLCPKCSAATAGAAVTDEATPASPGEKAAFYEAPVLPGKPGTGVTAGETAFMGAATDMHCAARDGQKQVGPAPTLSHRVNAESATAATLPSDLCRVREQDRGLVADSQPAANLNESGPVSAGPREEQL